jgi:manganese transport protein
MLGSDLAPTLFAIALIAAGQSSTITGTLAGQIVMEGYLHLRITPWVRRLMTRLIAVVPAVAVILINGENNIDSLLVLSQVVLSLQLGFAIIPLIHFTSDKTTMGVFAIKPIVIAAAALITLILVYLNIRMVYEQASGYFSTSESYTGKTMIVSGAVGYIALLLVAIFYPLMKKPIKEPIQLHPDTERLNNMVIPVYKKIAVALDFSKLDHKLIAHALGQGSKESEYQLIHIVESPASRIIGKDADDMETRKDQQRIDAYVLELIEQGFKASGSLGFDNRVKEIVRLVKESEAEILVIGAHGHSGIKDVVYGHTVESVRHELRIPVLVVNV